MNTIKFCLGLLLHMAMFHQQINQINQSNFIWCLYVSPWYIQWKCLLPFFPYLCYILYHIGRIFGLTKTSHEIFWFKDHMLIVPLLSFSTIVNFVTTSWAFEAVRRHLRYSNQCPFSLWPIVSFSMVLIFSLVKTRKFWLKLFMFLDMLSTFSGWAFFVEISSLTISTFSFGFRNM